jgi:hypothetical protein
LQPHFALFVADEPHNQADQEAGHFENQGIYDLRT